MQHPQETIFFRLTGSLPSSFTGDLRTKSAQNQLKSSLKTLAAQAFSRLRAAHRLRTKSVLKQQGDIFDGFLFFVVAGMNIAVHRSLEVRLSQDALDGLHVRASVVQHRAYRVPEDVRRGPMEVHRSVDALHHTSEGSERQRFPRVIAADDDDCWYRSHSAEHEEHSVPNLHLPNVNQELRPFSCQ